MSDDTNQLSLTAPPDEKSGKKTLTMDRVTATIDRTIQNRMRLMDRINGISLFRDADPKRPYDSKARPGDIPLTQQLFKLVEMFHEANAIEETKDRLRLQADLQKQITAILIHFSGENGAIFAELQRLKEHEETKKDGGINMEDLIKDAGM